MILGDTIRILKIGQKTTAGIDMGLCLTADAESQGTKCLENQIYQQLIQQQSLQILFLMNQSNNQKESGTVKKQQLIFQFPQMRKILKLAYNPKATLKSYRSLFATKFDYEFAHIEIKVFVKGNLDPLRLDTKMGQLEYFIKNTNKEAHTLQVEIKFEGG